MPELKALDVQCVDGHVYFYNIHGGRYSLDCKTPGIKFDTTGRLIVEVYAPLNNNPRFDRRYNRSITYIKLTESLFVDWVFSDVLHPVNDKPSSLSISAIADLLDKMNSASMSYHVSFFSDKSGCLEDENNTSVFTFNNEAEFVRLVDKYKVFEQVRRTWETAGLTEKDILRFLGFDSYAEV